MTDIQDTPAEVAAQKATTLIESLPWLKKFRDQIVVVKYGGNAMVSDELQEAFAQDIAYLRYVGVQPVVVHGGGPQISDMLGRLEIPSEFKGGYRVTNTEAIGVVRMVLTGQVNPQLVTKINSHGPIATGLSGEDAGLFGGRRRGVVIDGVEVDLGRVGDVVQVDPTPVIDHLMAGRIPVVSSIAADEDDPAQVLNVNADAAAASLAVALGAAKLVVLTDVAGLYADWPDRDSLVEAITVSALHELLPSLESGMIPKMRACLDAVVGGVGGATIIDGRIPHSILLEVFTQRGSGTEVVPDDRAASSGAGLVTTGASGALEKEGQS
jgi:acetylglutamate kinase